MADFTALKTAIQTYIKQNGNEEITGEILQEILLSVVTTLGDSAINDLITALADEVAARQNADGTLQQNITNEATARGNADTALANRLGSSITAENTAADQIGAEAEARATADTSLQGLIDGITDNIENGYVYAGIATPSSTPATGKVFYLALTAGMYTNFGSTEVPQGINILKYNGSAWSLDTFIGIDDELTPISNNLPKSGNVLENIIKNGSAFDLSAYNAVDGVLATYADLGAALTALNALPAVYKQGGMSFRFVCTSDNKYVQFRCIANEFTTDVTKWTIYSNDVLIETTEFIKVLTDKEGHIIEAYKSDGTKVYYVRVKGDFYGKLDINGNKLYDEDGNPEFVYAIFDKNKKIVFGIQMQGNVIFPAGVPSQIKTLVTDKVIELKTIIKELKEEFIFSFNNINNPYIKEYVEYNNCFKDCLGNYIASYRLSQALNTPYVDVKLGQNDNLYNSAGKTFYYNGYVYVYKYSNDGSDTHSESKYIHLAKVSTSDPTDITSIIAFDAGEVLTFADESSITITYAHEGNLYVVNDYIHVVSLIEYQDGAETKYQLVHKKYDLSLNQVGSPERCTFIYNGVSYNWNSGETSYQLLGDNNNAVFNSGITKHGTKYYGCAAINIHWQAKILETEDFINWEVFYILGEHYDKGFGYYDPYGEVALYSVDADNMILASRCANGPTVVIKLNTTTKEIVEQMIIKGNGTGSMPSFFKYNNEPYLLCNGVESRYYYKIIKINTLRLDCSYLVCDTNGKRFGPNTIVCTDGTYLYGCMSGVNLILNKFQLPTVTQTECDSILSNLLNV